MMFLLINIKKAAKEFIGNSGYGETSGNGDIMSLVNQEGIL
jgi:hypothetical protein